MLDPGLMASQVAIELPARELLARSRRRNGVNLRTDQASRAFSADNCDRLRNDRNDCSTNAANDSNARFDQSNNNHDRRHRR